MVNRIKTVALCWLQWQSAKAEYPIWSFQAFCCMKGHRPIFLFFFLNFFFFLDDFLFELIDEHIDPRIEFR